MSALVEFRIRMLINCHSVAWPGNKTVQCVKKIFRPGRFAKHANSFHAIKPTLRHTFWYYLRCVYLPRRRTTRHHWISHCVFVCSYNMKIYFIFILPCQRLWFIIIDNVFHIFFSSLCAKFFRYKTVFHISVFTRKRSVDLFLMSGLCTYIRQLTEEKLIINQYNLYVKIYRNDSKTVNCEASFISLDWKCDFQLDDDDGGGGGRFRAWSLYTMLKKGTQSRRD